MMIGFPDFDEKMIERVRKIESADSSLAEKEGPAAFAGFILVEESLHIKEIYCETGLGCSCRNFLGNAMACTGYARKDAAGSSRNL